MLEGFVQIFADILDVFDAEREAQQVGIDARGDELLLVELRMGGRGGMNQQRLRVADVGQMADEMEVVDDFRRLRRIEAPFRLSGSGIGPGPGDTGKRSDWTSQSFR